jgi:hypothetical protein
MIRSSLWLKFEEQFSRDRGKGEEKFILAGAFSQSVIAQNLFSAYCLPGK